MTPLIAVLSALTPFAMVFIGIVWLILHSRNIPRAYAALENITLPGGSGMPAVGTVLSLFNGGSPGVYNPVGNLSNLTWDLKGMTADTTNMGTVWKQHIMTLLDAGTISADLYMIPASVGQNNTVGVVGTDFNSPGSIGYNFVNRVLSEYSIDFPDGTTYYFSAYVEDFPIDANVEKALTVKIKFGLTGQPQFA